MKTLCTVLLILLAWPAALLAGTLNFKNGDRLSGHWLRVEGKDLVFKADAIGEVKIPLDKLQGFESQRPAVLMLENGEAVEGRVALAPSGNWKVETPQGTWEVPGGDVAAVYPQQVFAQQEAQRRLRALRGWRGRGSLGYNLAHGDTDAATLSINFNATRREPNLPGLRDRLRTNFFLNMLFANTQTGQGPRVSSNNINSGVRQDFLFSAHDFWFLLAQLDHSQTQSLNLRQTYGAGLGRDLLRRPKLALQLLSGVTFVRENFEANVLQKHSEGLLGGKAHWQIAPWLALDNNLNFYPALNWAGRYRFDGAASLNTRINSRLSFNTTFTDHYLSRPLPNKQKNDLVLTTGVGLRF
jgi:putative salt-induced outer membrane protein YdiY